MEISLAVAFTFFGVIVGSFLNVCIDHLPAGKSLVYPASHCDTCQHRLSPRDLIPVFSYIWLRGRCRYCQARIPRRILCVELLSGGLFLLAFWRFSLSVAFAITAFWCCVFLVIIFIDWEHHLILDVVTFPAALVALIILAFDSFLLDPGPLSNFFFLLEPSILSGIIAAAIGSIFFFLVLIIYPSGMGMGDVKLAGLIGLAIGFPLALVALFIGIFIGGLVAVTLLLLGIKGRKDVMPYGVFLGIGPIITLLWGNDILSWYLGLF